MTLTKEYTKSEVVVELERLFSPEQQEIIADLSKKNMYDMIGAAIDTETQEQELWLNRYIAIQAPGLSQPESKVQQEMMDVAGKLQSNGLDHYTDLREYEQYWQARLDKESRKEPLPMLPNFLEAMDIQGMLVSETARLRTGEEKKKESEDSVQQEVEPSYPKTRIQLMKALDGRGVTYSKVAKKADLAMLYANSLGQ